MKSFRFSMQALLTLREQSEQAAQRHFAQTLSACETIARRLQAVQAELQQLWNRCRTELQAAVCVQEIERLHAYGRWLEERQLALEKEWRAARQAMETARQHMIRATQQREVMEKHCYDNLARIQNTFAHY